MQRNPHSYQIATGYRTFYSLSLIYQPITKKTIVFFKKTVDFLAFSPYFYYLCKDLRSHTSGCFHPLHPHVQTAVTRVFRNVNPGVKKVNQALLSVLFIGFIKNTAYVTRLCSTSQSGQKRRNRKNPLLWCPGNIGASIDRTTGYVYLYPVHAFKRRNTGGHNRNRTRNPVPAGYGVHHKPSRHRNIVPLGRK